MAEQSTLPPDLRPIQSLIRRTARLLRSSWVATGMGLALGLGLGTLAAVALLDLAVPLLPFFRMLGLILVIVPSSWAFLMGVVRPLFLRLRPLQVARRIEAHLPGIHNRLVSCIDVETSGKTTAYSPEFYRRLVQEAVDRIRGFCPRKVIDGRSLGRAILFAAISIVTFAASLGLFSDRVPTALARIFSPFADIPPASGVVYVVEPGDASVLRGEDITFTARVERGEPERLQLDIEPDGNARALRYDLEKVSPSIWRLKLTGFESSFGYRVRGGGTWSARKRITVVDRPSIEGLSTILHYPEYMGITEPKVGIPQIADVSGPAGSSVEVIVESQGNVASGAIQLLAARPTRVAVQDRPERIWFQERLPAGASPEGRWDWDFRLLARPAHTEPASPGVHGHRFMNAHRPFDIRPGENLYAHVYIAENAKPEALMLSWHDGSDWEHRAYWGGDRFTEGTPGSPSRRHIGPLPEAGKWVRLELSASAVALEGKAVRGMAFTVAGGQCYWHRAGAVAPSHIERDELYVAQTVALEPSGSNRWKGRFRLDHDTLYRVELRNVLGYPSSPMKEAKATAITDEPPQAVLERPGSDVVLSKPAKLPLSIAAFDDFGLADIVVSVQRGESGGFIGRPIQHFDRPRKSANLATSLDVPAFQLKPGESLRYRIEARDRKGQSAQTQDFVVRTADDGNAADKQLESFDRSQDSLSQNLERLISEHAKVQESTNRLAALHAPLAAKIKEAQARSVASAPAKGASLPAGNRPLELDQASAGELDAMRREAGQLAPQEEQNAALADQFAGALKQSAEAAANLKMLPSELLRQLDDLQQAFKVQALKPMRDVASGLRRGADREARPPDLAALALDTDRIQRQLEAIRSQLAAADRARAELARDAESAVASLREDVNRAEAGLTERELGELRGAVQAREHELKEVAQEQAALAAATPQAPEILMPDLERRQGELEPREDQALEGARALLEAARVSAMRPGLPSNENAPESQPAEPAAAQKHTSSAQEGRSEDQEPRAKRAALQSRERARIGEIDQTQKALSREDEALANVLGQLTAALRGAATPAAGQRLGEIMRSDALRRALTLAQRNRQLSASHQRASRGVKGAFTDRPDQFSTTDKMVAPLDVSLPDLDLATQKVILKMQPQIREELLEGLREEGPEGYKTFIRNYFKRLTEVK
jgi:hypothetical protein